MDKSNVKVSVIVTTYNQEDTIARTLNSILEQQCDFPFEICLSDDCSSDATPRICREYAERHPAIIQFNRNKANRGCRDNYFDTLLRCRGKYIADCAGDDYWTDPHKLRKQVAVLDADQSITLVHTNWEYRDSKSGAISPSDPHGERAPYLHKVSGHGALFIPVLQHKAHSIIHLCTAMYRKDVFTRAYAADPYLFRHNEFPCEDFQLMVVYAQAGKIAYLPDVTMHYSVGHTSLSSQDNHLKTFDFYIGSLRLTIYLAEKYDVPAATLADTYRNFTSFLFAQAYLAQDKTRLDTLRTIISRKHLPLSVKSRILIPSIRFRPVWNLATNIKRLISRIKQSCK
ncbi:MAG: glycosyltransferase [Muribaculaceae bacterium]|nr:glycosyltransferase [Muribaculaceae bacterium]